jgi:hypothetical protein
LTPYADEARPYALMVGCISLAILAWQRIDDSKLYCALLTVSLAAATSLHYYAVFVWPAFIAAEATVWIINRRFRAAVWVSLALGASPLLLFAGMLKAIVRAYGQSFWAQPHFKQAYITYNNLLNVNSHWGVIFAIGITAVVVSVIKIAKQEVGFGSNSEKRTTSVPAEEHVLALVLLWMPVIAVIAAKIGHGGLTERHMLPAILGCALAVGYAIERTSGAIRLLLLILFLLNYEAYSVPVLREAGTGNLLARRHAAENEIAALDAELPRHNLSIVIGSELDYLPLAYYTPPYLRERLHAVVDPQSAVAYLNTASGDLNLLVIQHYYSLQVDDFDRFTSNHREFYLVAGADFDWLVPRLVHDGDTLKLVAEGHKEESPVYEVTMRANGATE